MLPFFIVGSPRSGTTLLVQILNRHNNIYIPPETAFFHHLSLFNKVKKEEQKLAKDISDFVAYYSEQRATKYLNLPEGKVQEILLHNVASYMDVFINLMNELKKQSKKQRWGEKTPHHLRCINEVKKHIPNTKYIIMVRDGRAVIKRRLKLLIGMIIFFQQQEHGIVMRYMQSS